MRGLTGRVVLVAGGARGIGTATSVRLAEEGALVVVADLNAEAASAVADTIRGAGGQAEATTIDRREESSVVAAIDLTIKAFGGLDVVHANADLSPDTIGTDSDVESVPLEVFDRTIAVNLGGHVLCARHAIPRLLERGGGAPVFTSSTAPFAGEPESPSYAMAKSGLGGLVRHVASRWGKLGIRANAVAPGLVLTETVRAGLEPAFHEMAMAVTRSARLGKPEDIAAMVALLASNDGAWINGQIISVDGGAMLRSPWQWTGGSWHDRNPATQEDHMDPIVTVTQGQLRGADKDGVLSFKGIPYAAAPYGPNRFAAPRPAPNWEGIRDAIEFGATSPAPPYPSPIDLLLPEPVIPGEDILNLNVWTPALDEPPRPVLVWIHGGGFVNGSNAVSGYDGTRFARDGVVFVSINYRLGAEGFLLIDGVPTNRGMLDQVAALQWVHDNIAAFGGDPTAVTIAGESAGAMSVTTLLSMPAAAGLIQRAIAQSGAGHHVLTRSTAAKVTAALAAELGVPATAEGFGSVPVDTLVAAQSAVGTAIAAAPDRTFWGEIASNLMPYEPVIDGTVVPARPIDRLAEGVSADVDVLIGTNSDEHTLFFVPSGIADFIDKTMLSGALTGVGADAEQVMASHLTVKPDATSGELLIAAMSDWFFRIPAVRVAEARLAQGADTYVYEFAWRSPQFAGRLGACHALEVGFVFDNLDDPAGEPLTGSEPPQSLADEMHRAWVQFVQSGDPGWPSYGTARTVRFFNEVSETVSDPGAEQRLVWEGVR